MFGVLLCDCRATVDGADLGLNVARKQADPFTDVFGFEGFDFHGHFLVLFDVPVHLGESLFTEVIRDCNPAFFALFFHRFIYALETKFTNEQDELVLVLLVFLFFKWVSRVAGLLKGQEKLQDLSFGAIPHFGIDKSFHFERAVHRIGSNRLRVKFHVAFDKVLAERRKFHVIEQFEKRLADNMIRGKALDDPLAFGSVNGGIIKFMKRKVP